MGTGTRSSGIPSRGHDGAAGGCSPDGLPAASLPPPSQGARMAEEGMRRAARMTDLSDGQVRYYGAGRYMVNLGGGETGPYGLRAVKAKLALTGIRL